MVLSAKRVALTTLYFQVQKQMCRQLSGSNIFYQTQYKNGPDQIIPTEAIWANEADGAIKIYRTPTGPASSEPISVHSMFKNVQKTFPNHCALILDRDGKTEKWNYTRYYEESHLAGKALIKLGLERFGGVCIMGFNSPEWFFSNFGTVFAGGLSAGIYTTNSAENCRDIALNCKAQIIIVDTNENLEKYLKYKKELPQVKAFVQWLGTPSEPGVLSWQEFLDLGRNESDDELNERLSLAAMNQCCTLIYTSGTTGPSKGVMLTQDQMSWAADHYTKLFNPVIGDSTGLSYLPLSHITAHVGEMYCLLFNGLTVHFAQPDVLKGSLGKSMLEIQPHGLIGIPRVWEKIYEKLQEVAAKNGPVLTAISTWAKKHGLNYYNAMRDGREMTVFEKINHTLAKKLVLNRVKKAIGLSRSYFLASGTAPIDPDILEYFMSLDLPIQEAYGLSESLSFGSFNFAKPLQFRLGSVGRVLPQTEMKLRPTSQCAEGEGEILMRGRNIMMGYLNKDCPFDDEGWFPTGDIGKFDSDGYLYITGRIKEIVITSGGENVPPVPIEEIIKKELPFVGNAVLIGDRRKYLTMLITLKSEVDLKTSEPLDELTLLCKKSMKSLGLSITTVPEAIKHVEAEQRGILSTAINDGITRYNTQAALSNAQKVQRWTILEHDFSQPTGELNSTMKLKRDFVLQKYKAVIDKMYM